MEKPKPKVLVDVFYLYVAQTGIRTYMVTLCEEILKKNNSHFDYVISPNYQKVKQNQFFRGKTAKWKNILFQLLYFFRKQVVLPILSYFHQADLVFSPDILSPVFAKGKKVSVVHDTFFWDNPEHYQALWLNYYLFFLHQGLKKNGAIITITEYSKSRLREMGLFANVPISVVHQASYLQSSTKTAEDPFPFPYFLHVGVLEKRKNLGMLIEAFAQLVEAEEYTNLKLVLVGQRGPRETLDDFENLQGLVKKYALQEKVLFPGYLSENEVKRYFSNALAYVFPSNNEGFGLPVLEAFFHGLPVIISNQGALKEVAGNAALILEENSVSCLLEALQQVASNPDLQEELIQKGTKRLQEFSTNKFFLHLERAFKELLNEKPFHQNNL
jgi:glycosyltransferase involved in cell wall biosynthesis